MSGFLTERQKQILEFIEKFRNRKGVSPTHREICEAFGYSSYGTVHKHLKLLEAKGFLHRNEHQKRGVELAARGASSGRVEIPFLGLIAAGQPIEAVPGDECLEVPPHLLEAPADRHYVLRVAGDSMIQEGIHDGDLVIVLQREQATPGEMVVALVGDEVTLKRFYPEGATIRLQPANPQMRPLRVPASQVRVQGVVVGLMRRF